jgi:hypothetical protein
LHFQVILKLVQQLATLQHQQKQQQHQNQHQPKGAIELDYFKQQLQNNFNSNKFNQLQKQQHQQQHQQQKQHPLKLASPEYLARNLNKSVEEVFEHPRHVEQGDINYKSSSNSNNNNDYNVANLNTNTSNHCQKNNNKNNLYSPASKKKFLNKTDVNSNSPPHPENVAAATAAAAKVTAKKLGGHRNLCASGGGEINNMGSNVSRQQIKGLSGRRTQSSGII